MRQRASLLHFCGPFWGGGTNSWWLFCLLWAMTSPVCLPPMAAWLSGSMSQQPWSHPVSSTSLAPRNTKACVEGYALDHSVCPYIAISPREAIPKVQVWPWGEETELCLPSTHSCCFYLRFPGHPLNTSELTKSMWNTPVAHHFVLVPSCLLP